MLTNECILPRYTMSTSPGQVMLFLPLVQMTTTQPVMQFVSPFVARRGARRGGSGGVTYFNKVYTVDIVYAVDMVGRMRGLRGLTLLRIHCLNDCHCFTFQGSNMKAFWQSRFN